MKPLLPIVVAILVVAAIAHPENIEEVKELPQSHEPVVEAEESSTQERKERCTACSSTLKLKTHKDVLAALQALPNSEVHTQESFEGCSSEKGCAGLKVKDGKVLERFGNLDAFKAAAAADSANEFQFHAAGSNIFDTNAPFWWMNENSPFKTAGNGGGSFEKFSKSSSSSFSSNGGADLSGNPFLNGDFSKLGAGFGGAGGNFAGQTFESSSSTTKEVDISKNPFLNGGANFGQASFGAQGNFGQGQQNFGQTGSGQGFNSFSSSSKFGSGYTGSSPAPFAPNGANVNLIQNSQKNEYDFQQQQQTQQNIDEAFQSTGNVQGSDGELQQTCAGQGYVCVHKAQCNNGVVNTNGGALLQANTQKQYCNTNTEICCRLETASLGGGSLQGSLGVGSATFSSQGSSQGSGLFGQSGSSQTNQNAFGSSGSSQTNQNAFGSSGSAGFGQSNSQGFNANRGNSAFGSNSNTANQFGSSSSKFGSNVGAGFGSTLAPTTSRFGGGNFNNEVFKQTSQSNFVETDSFSAGSENAGVFRPGAPGNGLKPGIPYLPPVDNSNSGSNVVPTAYPTPFTTPRPTTPRFTTPRPYTPSTRAPEYLPPVDNISGQESRPHYVEGQLILDDTLPPNYKPPQNIPQNTDIPAGCAAALKCTPIEFCTAEGVISNTTVILTRDQESYRVPLTDCKDLESGRIGKCCRDPYYTDPWPTNQLGKWVPGVFGGNDGKYVPDSRGSSNNIRPVVTVRPDTVGGVLLNNYRTTAKPTVPFGPNQVTPGYPSSTPGFGQKTQFGQGSYTQTGQGSYSQGGQGSYSQGGQGVIGLGGQGQVGQGNGGQFGQGSSFSQTTSSFGQGTTGQTVTQGQGSYAQGGRGQIGITGQGFGVTQGQGIGVTQGQGIGVTQGQGQIIRQNSGSFGVKGQGFGVTQGSGSTVSQGFGTAVTQGQGSGVSQGQGFRQTQSQFGISQSQGGGVSQGQGVGITQGQGFGVSQGQGVGVTQGQGSSVTTGQGFGVSRGQGQIVTQGQGQLVSQGQGQVVSQGSGFGVSQGQGQGVSQGSGFGVSQGSGQTVSQGAGFGVSQGSGQAVSQGSGFGVSQGSGFGVSQGSGFGVSQGQGQGISQGAGFTVTQGRGQTVSQGSGVGVTQGNGFGVSQGAGIGVTQGFGFGSQGSTVKQGSGFGVSQGFGQGVTQGQGSAFTPGLGFGVLQGQGQAIIRGSGQTLLQGQGQALLQGQGEEVSQGFGTGILQGGGFSVSQGSGFGVENEFGESVQRVFLQRYDGKGQCGIPYPQKPYGNHNDLEVDFAEIPWQAMVLLQTNKSLLCGGVITRPDVVLTSASCVEGLLAKNVLIKGGEYKLGIDEEPLPFQIVQVKHILRHPFYKSGSLKYDAAVLVLSENLRLAKNIAPICLPSSEETLDGFYNGAGECIVTGWGKIVLQAHLLGSIMHSVNVSLLNPGQCESKITQEYPHLLDNYDQDSCVCGQPTNPANNICKVDVGSALACTTGDNRYVLRGIYSWDSGCRVGNQLAAFYKFDLEWYEWSIGLIESVRFAQFTTTKVIKNQKITNQISGVKGFGVKGGLSGVKGVSGSSAFATGGFGQGQAQTDFSQFGSKLTSSDNKLNFGAVNGPSSNTFSATYTEKKFFQSEPQIVTYTTKPEIVTFTTKPEYFTFTTKPKYVTYTTKPEIVTYTTRPEIVTFTTKPKIVTYTTKPQIITYETSGSKTNPQYVSYTPSFSEVVGAKHTHDAQCKCLDGQKK